MQNPTLSVHGDHPVKAAVIDCGCSAGRWGLLFAGEAGLGSITPVRNSAEGVSDG